METSYWSFDTVGLGSESDEGSIGSSGGTTAITERSRESHFVGQGSTTVCVSLDTREALELTCVSRIHLLDEHGKVDLDTKLQ
jgi:hypothetical protein